MSDRRNRKEPSRENGVLMGLIMGSVLGVMLAGGTGDWWWIGVGVAMSMIIGAAADRLGREKKPQANRK